MRQFDRRLAYHFDWITLVLMLAIVALGMLTIFSATVAREGGSFSSNPWVVRQGFYAGVGLVGMFLTAALDYRRIERWGYGIYAGALVLLALVPLIGRVGGGARRWIDLGVVSIQPSEMIKVALVIALARYFHRSRATGDCGFVAALPAFVLLAVPAALILAQPDLGSAGLLVILCMSVLFFAGLRLRVLGLLAALGAAAGPILWGQLRTYQRQRVLTFLSPEMDPLGAGYHVIQSKIAIGSGMFWGKGFLGGTQNKLNFLPEQHTDFIFSVFAEEWGYVGALALLVLYAAMVLRGLQIANRSKDRFGAVLVFGVVAMIFWQVVINVGMTSGLLPVVGIPLPFFSYGGSSLSTMMVATGLIINVNMRRFLF